LQLHKTFFYFGIGFRDHSKNKTVNAKIWRHKIDDFVKLDRLMSEIIDFADSYTYSTILYFFFEKEPIGLAEIRTHDPWIRVQHSNIQRPSDHGYSVS
jgi:hypothetical protein